MLDVFRRLGMLGSIQAGPRSMGRAGRAVAAVAIGAACATMVGTALQGVAALAGNGDAAAQGLFLIDDATHPTVGVRWETIDGQTIDLSSTVPYTNSNERKHLGDNVEMFACVGGTRLEKGAGHPRGLIVRVGIYKHDYFQPLFHRIRNDSNVELWIRGVRFASQGLPRDGSVLQHLRYSLSDLAVCGLSESAMDQFNTQRTDDWLNGKISADNTRAGVLGGHGSEPAQTTLKVEDDGSVTLISTFPYSILRHIRDPWQRTAPGTFFEPYHLHVEFEALPAAVHAQVMHEQAQRDAEGIQPGPAGPAQQDGPRTSRDLQVPGRPQPGLAPGQNPARPMPTPVPPTRENQRDPKPATEPDPTTPAKPPPSDRR